MISFVDRTSMSAALADHQFVREFKLTHVQRGWLGSAVFWSDQQQSDGALGHIALCADALGSETPSVPRSR
jgi:hypothetical protein